MENLNRFTQKMSEVTYSLVNEQNAKCSLEIRKIDDVYNIRLSSVFGLGSVAYLERDLENSSEVELIIEKFNEWNSGIHAANKFYKSDYFCIEL